MLVVQAEDLETTINDVKEVFHIDNIFDVLTEVDDLTDYIDMWMDMFGGVNDESTGLTVFHSPLLIFTSSKSVVNTLRTLFVLKIVETGNGMFDELVNGGILPTDELLIEDYALRNYKPSDGCEHAIFSMFQTLGYIDKHKCATDRLLVTLEDVGTDECRKYAQTLLFIRNSQDKSILQTQQYESSLLEMLKLVNIHIHSAIYKIEIFAIEK